MTDEIARTAVHPAIKITRIGNPPAKHLASPETPEPEPRNPGFHEESAGATRRAMAPFRIQCHSAANRIVSKLAIGGSGTDRNAHPANGMTARRRFQPAADACGPVPARPSEWNGARLSEWYGAMPSGPRGNGITAGPRKDPATAGRIDGVAPCGGGV
ncbi:LodA/GoxA family CTQ-dependent oxidase [Kitasatospora sp. HPMI-4]|uniref:LodA/GoxA family CTQ-dependent oxidase n=1 Tax=Kitasatospora sp. HPMI-4 TaxID=3448443 RepID=UPI003F1D561A